MTSRGWKGMGGAARLGRRRPEPWEYRNSLGTTLASCGGIASMILARPGCLRIACTALLLFCVQAFPQLAACQISKRTKASQPVLGQVTIDRYHDLVWQPADNTFKSPGPVRIILTDAVTGEKTVIVADDAEGKANGDILVRGAVRLERAEGTLVGRDLKFNSQNQTGSVLEAKADLSGIRVQGSRLDLLPGRAIRATDAWFTTCSLPNPHFHITARQLEVSSGRRVKAKHVTFWLGHVRILSLPEISKSFSKTSQLAFPFPGYSKETGIQFHLQDDVVSDPGTLMTYDIGLSMRRTPTGTIAYSHDVIQQDPDVGPPSAHLTRAVEPLRTALVATPPPTLRSLDENPPEPPRRTTLYAMLTSSAFQYNRKRTDLRVSRLPEVGITIANLTGETAQASRSSERLGPAVFRAKNWMVNMALSAGYVKEAPTGASDERIALQSEAVGPFLKIAGPLHARFGFTAWTNLYGRGTGYALLAPEAELDYLVNPRTLLGASYLIMKDFGATPFAFDRRDITHELRLRFGHSGTQWALDLGVNYDLDRHRAYDVEAAVRRRWDCVEVGLGWRTRAQSVSLIFNLLPAKQTKVQPENP
ncbi:MAG: hypothetical protein ACP5VE_03500 [Chthonomonadales bacterium]